MMRKNFKNLWVVALMALCALPAMAQLSGTGFYRFRNAQQTSDYISIANDKFNYTTCIGTACGGLSQAYLSAGRARAMACATKFLQTDIHLIDDSQNINPGAVIYAKKKNAYTTNYDYNLMGQGTSLITLTTGTYPGSVELEFQDRYITIKASSGSGANTLYTASIELAASNMSIANLGTRYFLDENGLFTVGESSSANAAKWYIEPVTHFNVVPEVEFMGKYYTTLHVPYAFTLSGQVTAAYVITAIGSDGTLEYETIATTGETVPAGTPVVLECASDNPADCQLIPQGEPICTTPNLSVTSWAPTADETTTNYAGTNLLKGTYFCNTDGTITFNTKNGTSTFNANRVTNTSGKMVIGITDEGKLGFVKPTGSYMPANKAWLPYSGSLQPAFPWEPAPAVLLGDVNNDGVVTIKDVTTLIAWLLSGDIEPFNAVNADANENGELTVGDVTAIINILLNEQGNE